MMPSWNLDSAVKTNTPDIAWNRTEQLLDHPASQSLVTSLNEFFLFISIMLCNKYLNVPKVVSNTVCIVDAIGPNVAIGYLIWRLWIQIAARRPVVLSDIFRCFSQALRRHSG